MRIPLALPDVRDEDVDEVVRVLRSGRLSLGPRLEAFERGCADYLGTDDAIAVNSGTSGLHLAFLALGIGQGDEVITPAFSFVASASSILHVGATPVFADVDADTLCLDPAAMERAITERTRAVVVVHVFGRPAPMREIGEIAARHELLVIEDACEAFGAEIGGRKAGTLGDAGVYAFYPNKQITTAEGGLVVAKDRGVGARVRRLRNQGRDPSAGWLGNVELGYSFRQSELHCALGLSQLRRIESALERRAAIAQKYDDLLAGCPALRRPALTAPDARISWLAYVVVLAESFTREDRDRVLAEMAAREIECGNYFAPVHLQPLFRGLPGIEGLRMPVTEHVGDRTIALPFFHAITDAQIAEVCDALIAAIAGLPARGRP